LKPYHATIEGEDGTVVSLGYYKTAKKAARAVEKRNGGGGCAGGGEQGG